MPKRLRALVVILVGLVSTACGSQAHHPPARTQWPTRSTPLSSTLGWFQAIDAHDRERLLFYVAPSARDQMGWARPSVGWSKFTSLHCRRVDLPGSTQARVSIDCSFHESASPVEGNPDSFWDLQLDRTNSVWLIESYGQG